MLTKKLTNLPGKRIREYMWGKFPILKDTRTPFSRTLQLCCVPILHYKRIYSSFTAQNPQLPDITSFNKQIAAHKTNRIILWIDHNLGGGTETYSYKQFALLKKEALVLRLQYWHDFDLFFLHTPNREIGYCLFNSLDDLTDLPCTEIVVNNLVGYKNALDVLKTVNQFKKRHPEIKVSARGHDYFGICPSYTLLDNNEKFCGLKDLSVCASCCEKQTFHPLLRSGFQDIVSWRNGWKEFFDNTLDEMIVFSKSSQLLFERVYPQLNTKIKVIAHQVSPLPVVTVAPHKTVNIGFLGEASNVAKGKKVIEQICAQNTDPNTTFTLIGPYDKPPKALHVSGKYRREDLPELIKKYQLDIIFIPSIVPETFSYTTTEAMDMGLPVACYNMGAPAERVAGYKKGLVLHEINPKQNLQEIISFVLKNRKEN